MTPLIRFFVERPLFANLLTFLVIVLGIGAALTIQREAFPKVDFGIVTVTTIWPGASPSEVERLLTTPLERETKGIDGVKRNYSVSVENRSLLVFELDADLDGDAKRQAIEDIKQAVETVRDLPEDAEPAVVNEIKSTQVPIIEVNLSGADERVVRDTAKELEDHLLDVHGVATIAKRGWREREVLVEVDPANLRRFHVSLTEIGAALAGRNVNLPGGKIETEGDEWLVRAVGEFESAKDIEPVIIRANDSGGWVQVKDVANVRDALEDVTTINRAGGNRSIDLVVIKKSSADVITLVDDVRKAVDAFEPRLPTGVEVAFTNDFSIFVRRRLGIVVNNAYLGLGLVLVTLLLFLSLRVSFWTALGIPVSLMATLLTMQLVGMQVNLITMMGFILVIGMLVDDAIVVAENVFRYRLAGLPPQEAAVRGASEVVVPVAGSVLTTMAAFAPLAFMGGIFGKFVWAIPVVVILALGFSFIESMIALPAHLAAHGGDLGSLGGTKRTRFDAVADVYGAVVRRLLRLRCLVAIGLAGVAGLAVLAATRMDFQLFSNDGIEQFMVRAQTATGTPLEATEAKFQKVEEAIAALSDEELDAYTAQIGIQQQDPNDPFTRRGSHYAQAMVYLTPEGSRERTAEEIIEALRVRIDEMNLGFERVYFAKINPGPPVGKPISVRFAAEDFETLHRIEEMARAELSQIPGVVDLESDLEPGKKELRIKVKESAAAEAGLTATDIAASVRASFDGMVATKIRKMDEEIDVKVLFPEADRTRGAAALRDVRIPNRQGYLVPLSTVADIEEAVGFTAIKHEDADRIVTITGDVDPAVTSSFRANQALQPVMERRIAEFPGATVSFTGEDEDTKESFGNLGRAFAVAAALIFLIIASVFGSIWQPLLVMMTIPIGTCGVIFAFYAHGKPLGFLSMMGTIALAGVVVNSTIVLVDFVNGRRGEGVGLDDSIVEAARTRLRPILLTSATTLLGLLPTAYGIGGADPFVMPMALALSWGLAFSLVIALFAMPPAIRILDDLLAFPGWVVGTLRGTRQNVHGIDLHPRPEPVETNEAQSKG